MKDQKEGKVEADEGDNGVSLRVTHEILRTVIGRAAVSLHQAAEDLHELSQEFDRIMGQEGQNLSHRQADDNDDDDKAGKE